MRARRKPTSALVEAATTPVDGAALGVVRIVVGGVGLLSALRIWWYGWVEALYAGPSHRFTYLGFGWIPQPSVPVMHGLVALLAVSSIALAVGWRTRLASGLFLLAIAWIELIDATTYLNHYWFLTLVAALGVVVPWGASLSLDARRAGGPTAVARGWVWLLRFQVGVVYAFAGLAKLQHEWLVDALPLRLWLPARTGVPILGHVVGWSVTPSAFAIGGAVFDCLIVPALLWRRTRLPAWCVLVAFHVCTWALFPIGVFPWLMIGASTVFFAPDWPRRWISRAAPSRPRTMPRVGPARRPRWLVPALVVWVAVQLVLPLRHLLYPGDHRWTGQGYRFAWNVLLTEKSGSVTFLVHDPATDRDWVADPSRLYTRNQLRVMASEPDLIHQAAKAIAADAGGDVEVRVDAWLSFDGRPPVRYLDPTVDLAHTVRDPWPDAWILPSPQDL